MGVRLTRRLRRPAAILSLALSLLGAVMFSNGGRVRSARDESLADLTAVAEGAECGDFAEPPAQEGRRGGGRESGRGREDDGSDISPYRCISDPYPTFNGVAVDPEN